MINQSNFHARGLTELTGKDYYTWHSGYLPHVFHTHIKMAHEYKLYYFQHLLLFHLKQLYFAKVWQFLHTPFHDSKRIKLLSNLGTIHF
jgi:hypothetical protein